MTWTQIDLSSIGDADLLAALDALTTRDQRLTADLLLHMGEVDRRKLYLDQACSSMFVYCVQRLHMAEPTAYKRLRVARVAADYPIVLELIASGAVHVSAVTLLAPHLTADNHRKLLAAARHLSKRQVELLIATRFPVADAPPTLRKLPQRRQPAESAGGHRAQPDMQTPPSATAPTTTALPAAPAHSLPGRNPASCTVAPTAAERYRVQLTIDGPMHAKLRRAQELLRHQVPDGDLTELFDRALTLLVEKLERSKLGTVVDAADRGEAGKDVVQPMIPAGAGRKVRGRSRHIPNRIRRQVFSRDAGRCTFVDTQGHRCSETGMLEFHHCEPYCRGGAHSLQNITLRCRAHNQHAARRDLGQATSRGGWLTVRDCVDASYRVPNRTRVEFRAVPLREAAHASLRMRNWTRVEFEAGANGAANASGA